MMSLGACAKKKKRKRGKSNPKKGRERTNSQTYRVLCFLSFEVDLLTDGTVWWCWDFGGIRMYNLSCIIYTLCRRFYNLIVGSHVSSLGPSWAVPQRLAVAQHRVIRRTLRKLWPSMSKTHNQKEDRESALCRKAWLNVGHEGNIVLRAHNKPKIPKWINGHQRSAPL